MTDRGLSPPPSRVQRLAGRTGAQLWHARVAATPHRPFLTFEGRTWSFAQADLDMRRLAAGLTSLGVAPGVRVLVAMRNSAQTFLVHAALRELGAVMVPLVPGLTFAELAFAIEHCQATFLIAGDPLAATLLPELSRLPTVSTVVLADTAERVGPGVRTAALDELLAHAPRARAPITVDRAPWAIFYTSGSTGTPKGVMLPAGALPSAGAGYAERFGVRGEDAYILATPMAHAVGGLTVPGMALYTGCRVVILDRFSPSRFWAQVQETQASVSILFPAHLNLLLELERGAPGPGETSLRLAITHQWLSDFRRRFGVELGLCWGMTETGGASAGSPPGYAGERGDGYIGPGMHGVEMKIIDGHGVRMPAGQEGEICLRHEHQMLGYLNDAEASRRVMPDGWVHSGDLGLLDGEGHLHFRGRIKNMIKRSGENISPEEVENLLARHPDVIEALVLGVPDPVRTEEVVALVVGRPGVALDPGEISRFAEQGLARFKAPRYVAVRTEPFERLAGGKVNRRAVLAGLELAACWDRESGRRRSSQSQTLGPSKP